MVKHTQTIRLARKGLSELERIDLLLFPLKSSENLFGGEIWGRSLNSGIIFNQRFIFMTFPLSFRFLWRH